MAPNIIIHTLRAQEPDRQRLKELAKAAGYQSLNQFCIDRVFAPMCDRVSTDRDLIYVDRYSIGEILNNKFVQTNRYALSPGVLNAIAMQIKSNGSLKSGLN